MKEKILDSIYSTININLEPNENISDWEIDSLVMYFESIMPIEITKFWVPYKEVKEANVYIYNYKEFLKILYTKERPFKDLSKYYEISYLFKE